MTGSSRAARESIARLLRVAIGDPERVVALGPKDLDLMLRVTRRARLLGKMAVRLQDAGLLDALPLAAIDQLRSALVVAESRARLALWELDRIGHALSDSASTTCIAMKGCAYLLLGLPVAQGRIFADVDLMLPEAELSEVEAHLNRCGWQSGQLTPYDQNYYRKWTHELPPLVHLEREVEIDLHHNILPRTARLKPSAVDLLQESQCVKNSVFRVLSNEDIVLHAMTHLMFNDDLADKLRELVDIAELLQHFADGDAGFWQRLVARVELLDLRRPAFYSLHYVHELLGCAVPQDVLEIAGGWGPPAPIAWLMDKMVPRALFPPHPDHPGVYSNFCRLLLYVRSHWIRMPPWLLVYHLAYKFCAALFGRKRSIQGD